MKGRAALSWLLVPLAIGVGTLGIGVAVAPAAENFACGPGGKPNPKTAVCDCPAGKVEKTSGGTSRCVDKPSAPTATGTATGTGTGKPPTKPSTTTTTTTTTATTLPTVTLPTTSCGPGKVSYGGVCVDLCTPDQKWEDGRCVAQCAAGEKWNGTTCERPSVPMGTSVPTPTCTDGKVLDPSGHCCFPGQNWGDDSKKCRGRPACPTGYVEDGETCILAQCNAGMERVGDGLHCCWPGQEWAGAIGKCVGVPSCPTGFEASGDTCRNLRICDPGKVGVDAEHCCWPGQHWATRADGYPGCAGVPTCPPPLLARGEDCLSTDMIAANEETASRSAFLGAKYLSWDLGFAYGLHQKSITTINLDLDIAYHLPGVPIRLGVGLLYGGFKQANAACGPGNTCEPNYTTSGTYAAYFLGAYFAPVSSPNYAKVLVSYFNPYGGLELRGDTFKIKETGFVEPSGSAGFVLSLGNVTLMGPVSFTYSYSLGLSGDPSSRVGSMFLLSLGIVTARPQIF